MFKSKEEKELIRTIAEALNDLRHFYFAGGISTKEYMDAISALSLLK